MKNPLVSIVIPSYNNGHLLNRLINCLLAQTYKNWEALIIDNNSIDNTDQILNKLKDKRFKISKINNNGIIAKSRNLGMKLSQGEWIAFLDSDDWWEPNKLEICIELAIEGYDLIYHKMQIIFDSSSSSKKIYIGRNSNINHHKDLLINGNFIPNSSVVIKKNILNPIGEISENPNLIGAEDYNYLLRISKFTNKIKYINQTLGYYYISSNGVSRKNMATCHLEAVKEFLDECSRLNRKFVLANVSYINGKYNYLHSDLKNSKKLLYSSLKNGNISIKIKSIYLILKIFLK
jgi:glycosyltransferase involved in cell wall biosynthesis